MNQRKNIQQVELLNIPHYQQGDFDGLCSYYAGAMMLASLYPRFSVEFGELHAKRGRRNKAVDPIIQHFSGEYRDEKPGKDDRYVLARWFYDGVYIKEVGDTLNRIMKHDSNTTRFRYKERKVNKGTFGVISRSIDKGLPVLIGWETNDYGNHAVLVKGYWYGDDDWLLLNDPGGETRMSFQVLHQAVNAKIDVLDCDPCTHSGPRPDKAVHSTDGAMEIQRWKAKGYYESLEEHFQYD